MRYHASNKSASAAEAAESSEIGCAHCRSATLSGFESRDSWSATRDSKGERSIAERNEAAPSDRHRRTPIREIHLLNPQADIVECTVLKLADALDVSPRRVCRALSRLLERLRDANFTLDTIQVALNQMLTRA